jgi:hypothetical protein
MGRGALAWIAFTIGLQERADDVVAAFERRARMRREQLQRQRESAAMLRAELNAWRRRMERPALDDASQLEEGDA